MTDEQIEELALVIDPRAFEPPKKPEHLVTYHERQAKNLQQMSARGLAERILKAGWSK